LIESFKSAMRQGSQNPDEPLLYKQYVPKWISFE